MRAFPPTMSRLRLPDDVCRAVCLILRTLYMHSLLCFSRGSSAKVFSGLYLDPRNGPRPVAIKRSVLSSLEGFEFVRHRTL